MFLNRKERRKFSRLTAAGKTPEQAIEVIRSQHRQKSQSLPKWLTEPVPVYKHVPKSERPKIFTGILRLDEHSGEWNKLTMGGQ